MNQLIGLLLISLTTCGNEHSHLTMDKQITQRGTYSALIQYHGDNPVGRYISYIIP